MRVSRKFISFGKIKDEIPYQEVNDFIRRTYFKHTLIVFVGFLGGLRIAGALFFNQEKLDIIKEKYEEEYWKELGKPKHSQAEWVPCVSLEKKGQLCPTWIKINIENEKYIRKIDPAEFILEENTDANK